METTAVAPALTQSPSSTPHGFEALGTDDFFKLLIAQLSNQDPLEPTSNQELLNQISSIRDIEASTNLTETLQSLVSGQGFGSAATLLGQYVSGQSASDGENSTQVAGVVAGLRQEQDGTLTLLLDTGAALPMSQVREVTSAAQYAEGLKGRLVRGVDRSDPLSPVTVEGLVTGIKTESGRVLLELDNGQSLPLTGVTAVGEA